VAPAHHPSVVVGFYNADESSQETKEDIMDIKPAGAVVVKAFLNFGRAPAEGYVIARWHDDIVVWHVYRHPREEIWECETGNYFHYTLETEDEVWAEAYDCFVKRCGLGM